MFNVSSWWNFISCKIPLLSSNTKKGEIERTCPRFWVLVNNNRIYLMCVMGIDHVWDKYSYNQQQPKRKRSLSSDWMCNHLQTGLSGADNPAYQNLVSTDKGQHSVPSPDIWKYPGRIIRPPRTELDSRSATLSTWPGYLEISGPDNPASQFSGRQQRCNHSVPGPDIWKYPGRIIRSAQSWFSKKDADTQYLARTIANIRSG